MLRIIVFGLAAIAVGLMGGWTFGVQRRVPLAPMVEVPRVPPGDPGANVGDEIIRLAPTVKAAPARLAVTRPIETPLSAQPGPVSAPAATTAREAPIEVKRKRPRHQFRRRDDDDD
jgi:hypothetical protein